MELQDDSYCFVCGAENSLGLRLKIHYADGRASLRIRLGRVYQGWEGIIHGGFVSMLSTRPWPTPWDAPWGRR